jgi:hypothetical protein
VGHVSTLSRMEGFWPIFFLLVVLKIPVFFGLWLIWWASREPETETTGEDTDGGFKRWMPGPTRPRGPHSGPYGGRAIRRVRAHPAELVSDRRERVPLDGRGPSPSPRPAQTR